MRSMTNLEYRRIVDELRSLIGKHFSKIWKFGTYYRIKIGDADIICEPGVRLHITSYLEAEGEIDGFCQKLRKELDNAKLVSVEQVNNDRVVVLKFYGSDLYLEMFGKGNMILVRDGKAVAAMKIETWADRVIKPRVEYSVPRSTVVTDLSDALSEKYIIACMMKLPIGKQYAQEILHKLGIDEKTQGTSLGKSEIGKVESEIKQMLLSANPMVFYDNGVPVDFGLTSFSVYSGNEHVGFGNLSQAADEFYFKSRRDENPELEKLEKRLEKQKERLQELKREEKEAREAGDFIYKNFHEIDGVLKVAGEKDAEELLKKYKPKINRKEKQVEIELE